MYTTSRAVLTLATVLVVVGAVAATSTAQGLKIGFIDDDLIKERYKAWQRAQEQWEIESRAWDEEALTKQTELEESIEEYEKQKLILSEEKKNEREKAIRDKRDALDAFTRQVYGPGGSAEKKQMELIQPLLENVNKAI